MSELLVIRSIDLPLLDGMALGSARVRFIYAPLGQLAGAANGQDSWAFVAVIADCQIDCAHSWSVRRVRESFPFIAFTFGDLLLQVIESAPGAFQTCASGLVNAL